MTRTKNRAAEKLLEKLTGMSSGLNCGVNSINQMQAMLVNLIILQKDDLQLLSVVLSLIRNSYF